MRPSRRCRGESYAEPPFEEIMTSILGQGLALSERTIRRYHLSLKSRGFVVLSGVSGTGKTWLAQAYAQLSVPLTGRASGAQLDNE